MAKEEIKLQTIIGENLRTLSHGLGVQGTNLKELLTNLQPLTDYWRLDLGRDRTVEDVRQDVTDRLGKHIDTLQPRAANQELATADRVEQYRFIARAGFNIADKARFPELLNRMLMKRHKWLEEEAPQQYRVSDDRTSQRELLHVIAQIEQQILDNGYNPDNRKPSEASSTSHHFRLRSSPSTGQSVPRAALERALNDAIQASRSGDRLVLVYGQGGMGKTTLVREFLRATDHEFIDMGNIELASDSILSIIEARDMSVSYSHGSLYRQLRKILESAKAPAYLILDDIDTPEPLQVILSASRPATTVIATARRNLLRADQGIALEVKAMESAEAVALLSQRAPALSREQALELNTLLDGHPLAIKQAGAYLSKYEAVPVDEFCEALRNRSAEVLRILPVDTLDIPLLGIYQEIIEKLEGSLALALLRAKVYMTLPHRSLKRYLIAYGRATSTLSPKYPTVAETEVNQALEELASLALLDYTENYVSMHALTHAVFRSLFRATGQETCDVLLEVRPVVIGEYAKLTLSLYASMGESFLSDYDEMRLGRTDFLRDRESQGWAMVRHAGWILWIEEAEISRLRAELFSSPENREHFRQVLAQLYVSCLYENESHLIKTLPSTLTPYFDWILEEFASHAVPRKLRRDRHKYMQKAAQEALEFFMPEQA